MATCIASQIWAETKRVPEMLERTLENSRGRSDTASILADSRRIVATGNGAAFYVARLMAVLASASGASAPDVVAVPSGVISANQFAWRSDDALLVVSSSGELRDIVELLLLNESTRPFCAITANPASTIGARAVSVTEVCVESQNAATHTQAFIGCMAQSAMLWASISGDSPLYAAIRAVPEQFAAAVRDAEAWAIDVGTRAPVAGLVFGMGAAEVAALETALLLKEVALVPAEGMDTREGATTGMYPLTEGHLVVSIASQQDPFLAETESICGRSGATVVSLDRAKDSPMALAPFLSFPKAVALAASIGLQRGIDVDRPPWADTYFETARMTESVPMEGNNDG